jgi:hypothetical protein
MLDTAQINPAIGYLTGLHYDEDPRGLRIHDWYAVPVDKTWNNATIPQAYDLALKEADYLIVTHPNKLFAFGPSQLDAVYGLFSDMAELARYKNGALGYMENYDKELLRELIKPGVPFILGTYLIEPGKWSGKLKSDWASDGYLLLVGENQIIPGWSIKMGTHVTTTGTHTWIADPTDYPYASTYGDDLKPELSMGRIIGDNPTELRKPIRTSLEVSKGSAGYQFDRTDSLLISGFPRSLSGNSMNILTQQEVDGVLTQISQKPVPPRFSQTIWHTPAHTIYDGTGGIDETATSNAIKAAFLADTPDQDVIFLAGHGNADSWDQIHRNDIVNQAGIFGNANPFVFVSSCLTGKYTGGSRFAEAFLAKGAAAYLGAVEKGGCYKGQVCPGSNTFFNKWDLNEPVGLALKQTKLSLGNSFTHRLWK